MIFGSLKPKFHLLLHYFKQFLKNGPVSNYSSMRFESQHRIIKTILSHCSSHRQILKTVCRRYLLSIMGSQYGKYKDNYVTYGLKISDDSVNIIFSSSKVKYAIQNVTINSFYYAKDTIIVINSSDEMPMFGQICNIYVVDNEIVFQYIKLSTIGFNSHYFAYSVSYTDDEEYSIAYDLLTTKLPCLLFELEEALFIVTGHLL